MFVSVVIPAYNAEKTLAACLKACLDQGYVDREVIVVDDGSTDATSRVAQEFPIHYLRQKNAGPAAARNCGARAARGEVIAFTDADCVPESEWLERLMQGFEPGVAAVGGSYAIANPEHRLARIVHEEIVARHAGFGRDVDFLGSFNVAYRREAFEAAGGFDEAFRAASGEDNDLAYRLAQAGGRLRFVPDARVAHYHPTRLWPYLKTQMRHGFWRMKLYAKHPHRAGGDRYAGWPDLLAPPLALALAMGFVTLACAAWLDGVASTIAAACLGATCLAYGAIHLRTAWRVARGAREPVFAPLFMALASCRDLARAIGLVRGVWHFLILRKASV